MLGRIYQWLWFRFEFWLTPVDRRPLTFIFRDFIFGYPWRAVPMIIVWYIGLITLHFFYAGASLGLGIVSSFVLAHIVWGEKWLFGKQEDPQYLGDS